MHSREYISAPLSLPWAPDMADNDGRPLGLGDLSDSG
jgi:hypothetical protein